MAYTDILYGVDGHVASITLNRPDKLNAFTGTMMNELIDAFGKASADDAVRVVVVTGAGRGFCAGADLSAGASTFDPTTRPDKAGAAKTVDWSDERVRDGGGSSSEV